MSSSFWTSPHLSVSSRILLLLLLLLEAGFSDLISSLVLDDFKDELVASLEGGCYYNYVADYYLPAD